MALTAVHTERVHFLCICINSLIEADTTDTNDALTTLGLYIN